MLDSELNTVQDLVEAGMQSLESLKEGLDIDAEESCCESSLETFNELDVQLEDLFSIESKIIKAQGVSRLDATTLESWHPGIFGNKVHIKSFTKEPSVTNFRIAIEAINWKKVGLISASVAVVGGSLYLIYKNMKDQDAKVQKVKENAKKMEREAERKKKEYEDFLANAEAALKKTNASDEIMDILQTHSTHSEFIVKRVKLNAEYDSLLALPPKLRNRCFLDMMDSQPSPLIGMWNEYIKYPLRDSITNSMRYYEAIFNYVNMVFRELNNFEQVLENDMDPFDFDDVYADWKAEMDERWRIRQNHSKLTTQPLRDFVRKYDHYMDKVTDKSHWTMVTHNVNEIMTQYLDAPITHDDLNRVLGEVQTKSIFYYVARQYNQNYIPFSTMETTSKSILKHARDSSDWNEKITEQVKSMEKSFADSKWQGRVDEMRRNELGKWAASQIGLPNGLADAMGNVRANTLPDNNSLGPHLRDKLKEVLDFAVKAQNSFTFETRQQLREISNIMKHRAEFTRDTYSLQTVNYRLMDMHFQSLLAGPHEYLDRYETLIAELTPFDDSKEVRDLIKATRNQHRKLKKYTAILVKSAKW